MPRRLVKPTRQSGATLIEALVVMALFAMGMVSLTQLQTPFATWTEGALLRAQATHFARQKLDELRALEQASTSTGGGGFDGGLASSVAEETLAVGKTTFKRSWQEQTELSERYRVVVVTVGWTDRAGPQSLAMPTVIVHQPPDGVARLTLPSQHETRVSMALPQSP